jgi:hypothetical protein
MALLDEHHPTPPHEFLWFVVTAERSVSGSPSLWAMWREPCTA